jgi:hypothetical protein
MPRNKSNQSTKILSTKKSSPMSQQTNSSYQALYLWTSFLLGMISLGIVVWQRMNASGPATTDNQFFTFILPTNDNRPSFSYKIQFPGLVPLTLSALAYQLTGNRLVSLGTVMEACMVAAQGAAPMMSINKAVTMNQSIRYPGQSGDSAGSSLCAAGDVNGDRKMDFLIGGPDATNLAGQSFAGVVYLVYGSAGLYGTINLRSLSASQGAAFYGPTYDVYIGDSVSPAGDVNSDGFSDFLIGTLQRSSRGTVVYLIYGGKNIPNSLTLGNLTSSQGVTIQGLAANNPYGSVVIGSVGDFNGDSKPDFLVAIPDSGQGNGMYTGVVYVIYGGQVFPANLQLESLTSSQAFIITNTTGVNPVGDFNGDGLADLFVEGDNTYLIYGSRSRTSSISLATLTTAQGTVVTGWPSYGIVFGGDVNGDGKNDLLVGDSYAPSPGEVYLIYGSSNFPTNITLSNLTAAQGVIVRGVSVNEAIGGLYSFAGDVNGDGKTDFLITESNTGGTVTLVYLIYGGTSLPAIINLANLTANQGLIFQGEYNATLGLNAMLRGDEFGVSLAGLGDVNGDNLSDFLIGAPTAPPNDTFNGGQGIVYLVYGARPSVTPSTSTKAVVTSTTSSVTTRSTNSQNPTPTSSMTTSTSKSLSRTTKIATSSAPLSSNPIATTGVSLVTVQSGASQGNTQSGEITSTPTVSGSIGQLTSSSSQIGIMPVMTTQIPAQKSSQTNNSIPAIAGGVAGGVVVLGGAIAACSFWRKKNKKKNAQQNDTNAVPFSDVSTKALSQESHNPSTPTALPDNNNPRMSEYKSFQQDHNTPARSDYVKIDEEKKPEKQYDRMPVLEI